MRSGSRSSWAREVAGEPRDERPHREPAVHERRNKREELRIVRFGEQVACQQPDQHDGGQQTDPLHPPGNHDRPCRDEQQQAYQQQAWQILAQFAPE